SSTSDWVPDKKLSTNASLRNKSEKEKDMLLFLYLLANRCIRRS
ncbi:hypothetical protein Tco_0196721, partial [Tanacetum coccineum]